MKIELPTLVYQEENCVKAHAQELAAFGKKAFIITGHSSSKKNGSLKDTCDALESQNVSYVIFDQIEENPSVESCKKAAEIGLKENVDFCIGIGGGSPLDASKSIALLLGNKNTDTSIFYEPTPEVKPAIPVVAIPTTAGTGSEVTPYSVLTRHEKRTKKSIAHRIFPVLALCDARYLSFAPVSVLKNTAIDALAHLVESYLNVSTNVYNRMFSEYGLKLWGSVKDKLIAGSFTEKDYETLMETATVAGMAITHTSTSIPHGLSYALTYEKGVAHGAACGLFLPGYIAFCMECEEKGIVSEAKGITPEDTKHLFELLGLNGMEDFEDMMKQLLGDLTMPADLWKADVELMIANPNKLKTVPYTLDQEALEKFIK